MDKQVEDRRSDGLRVREGEVVPDKIKRLKMMEKQHNEHTAQI